METNLLIASLIGIFLLAGISAKWSLPFKKAVIIISIAVLLSLISIVLILQPIVNGLFLYIGYLLEQLLLYIIIILYLFFRDPQRNPPDDSTALVSPADGTVIYIKKLINGELISSKKKNSIMVYDELRNTTLAKYKLWQIGINLVLIDIHINRSPITGRVSLLLHKKGKFLSLRNKDAVNLNERQIILIENESIVLAVILIASRLVRRIESYIVQDESVLMGEKIGMIKFGSQVDIFIPMDKVKEINVKVGDYIKAGESIIGKISK